MLFERAELVTKEGAAEAFQAAMTQSGIPLLLSVPGVLSVQFGPGVENPGKFLLLVRWDSMAAHQAYGGTQAAQALRQLMFPHVASGAMEHFELG